MTPDMLLSGSLEPTNQWYAVAKIAGIKLCEAYRQQYGVDFVSVMPTNLYGPGDNYHPEDSHVPAGLMRRFHEAKISGAPSVAVWGTGSPRREFLAVDDFADACVFVMKCYSDREFLNVGTGIDTTIAEFARLIADVVGYRGTFNFDTSRPDGTPRREFLYVDDVADACVHLMKTYSSADMVNIGTGDDITIAEFAHVVAAVVGYTGTISFDTSRPDGTPRKLLDVSRLAKLGWRARTPLEEGIGRAYRAYLAEHKAVVA
jgi:nucleoside-diphosphate-sugar epimerase